MSANGDAIAGVTDAKYIWIWTPIKGTTNVATEPTNYHSDDVAINADGTVVAGIFQGLGNLCVV